jgi:pyruvyltransferase
MPTKIYPFYFLLLILALLPCYSDLPLYYWRQKDFENFGDILALHIVERLVGGPVRAYRRDTKFPEKKLLGLGSLLYFAATDDILWGTGYNDKNKISEFQFTHLDVRAIRGPLTREFLRRHFNISCPEIYGDPALLIPYLFPEFKRKENPSYDYIIIPHYKEELLFPQTESGNVVYSTGPWREIIEKILDSKFVIAGSLHGIIVAEAFGIPARMLRVMTHEPLFKFADYYLGTNRPLFRYATSIEEALELGGEPPFECDLEKLYSAFPSEYWPPETLYKIDFSKQHDE